MKKAIQAVELARYYTDGKLTKVTVKDYHDFFSDGDPRARIANFIYHRLHSRYLKPFQFAKKSSPCWTEYKEHKNGFSIMANCCLLIETLESFKHGWGDTSNKSKQAFVQFFTTDKNFTELAKAGEAFYKHIRCGILHQGETTGGWKIDRENKTLITDKTIHAAAFIEQLHKSLTDYKNNLTEGAWDSEIWDNFRTKMRHIIRNCEP